MRAQVPKAFHSAFASVCPLNLTGPGGFMDHGTACSPTTANSRAATHERFLVFSVDSSFCMH